MENKAINPISSFPFHRPTAVAVEKKAKRPYLPGGALPGDHKLRASGQ